MKGLIVTVFTLLMLLCISTAAIAQTRVTGRIFAEVVELTGAESNASSYVEVSTNAVSAGFDLGEISFRGKANTAYDLMVSSSDLVGSNGHEAPFHALPEELSGRIDPSGNQVIRLKGSSCEALLSSSERQFAGNYQVVFAYN